MEGSLLPSVISNDIKIAVFQNACPFINAYGSFDSTLILPYSHDSCIDTASGVVGRGFVGAIALQVNANVDFATAIFARFYVAVLARFFPRHAYSGL